jgi:hypothetical protein
MLVCGFAAEVFAAEVVLGERSSKYQSAEAGRWCTAKSFFSKKEQPPFRDFLVLV